ncbi:phosphatidylglycerophosphate synthase [Hamadaea flava]|uniref:CDP-alcohol phosphatidyltransferase family protein n=1 Tax=Hamadaea flava TaxID=1742688 RepID=A0ABV8LYV8_9ACTN|nr:CDP-alcohol phosphatidyltransferase family protein [Hamadaea flava]MCP2322038.1 phosphatidylglycerophosphate synthase [Hamadaea flava]
MMRTGPVTGLAVQVGLLAGLSVSVGLTGLGWTLGVAYGLAVAGLLTWALWTAGRGLGPADGITLARATLVGGILAMTVGVPGPVWVIVWTSTLALVLDAIDGWIARRTGTDSPLGARFDMEVDAFLLLVLAIYVGRSAGLWVALIGFMRYLYALAGWLLPWLRGQVPYRYWRKVVAAVQGIVLVCAASGLFPHWLVLTTLAVALALLLESFGRDVVWLAAQRFPALRRLGPLVFPTAANARAWDGRPLVRSSA